MSNRSKLYILFIEDEGETIDAPAKVINQHFGPLLEALEETGVFAVVPQVYKIGDPLPEGFIVLSAPARLSAFVEALEKTGQADAVSRILPVNVPMGTALAAVNKHPFPAIVGFEDFFNFVENGKPCSLIIRRDQRQHYTGPVTELVKDSCRVDGQDLVQVITARAGSNRGSNRGQRPI